MPKSFTVNMQINKILRAICGHFLAMKTLYDNQTPTDKYLRAYVWDESLKLENEKLFSWFYPYSTVVNARDLMIRGHHDRTHPTGFVSVMAACPLAYIISPNDETSCRVDDLGKYSTEDIEDIVSITLHFDTTLFADPSRVKHFTWPLNISNDEYGAAFIYGNEEIMGGSRIGVTTGED